MKFREKRAEIDAVQFDGDNFRECEEFVRGHYDNKLNYPNVISCGEPIEVRRMDWIVKDVNGDFFRCAPDLFEAKYEQVDK